MIYSLQKFIHFIFYNTTENEGFYFNYATLIILIFIFNSFLDMTRTAVNVTGDAICTTIVAKQEDEFNESIFYSKEIKLDNGVPS